MSCRRQDRARFIGCHVGAVRIRGCGRGCCPYGSDEIAENERYSFGKDFEPVGPSDSRFAPCRNPYRPKYVCVDCRRSFKLCTREENEYSGFDNDTKWLCRPHRDRIPQVWANYIDKCKEANRLNDEDRKQENQYMEDLFTGKKTMSEEKIQEMREWNPECWWKIMSNLRCPECGKEGKSVGGTFRAPAKKDNKGWKLVEKLLNSGENFSYCATVEEMEELKKEAARLVHAL